MLKFTFLLAVLLAMPAAAAPCYGPKEVAVARQLLSTLPVLKMKLDRERKEAQLLRDETCGAVELLGTVVDVEYAYFFFHDTGWRPIWVAAQARSLDPLRVQAAIVDLHFSSRKRKTTA